MKEVKAVHDIHVWSLDGEFHVASLHIVVKNEKVLINTENLKQNVRAVFIEEGIKHVTVK